MHVKVGTFNLNNLFSRFNFSAEVSDDDVEVEVESRTTFNFDDPAEFKLRSYQGRLVKGKPKAARGRIAKRIAEMDLDVLAVQEVEDVDTLAHFAREELEDLGYRHVVLVEGNDPRLIDVGLLSRLPLGGVTSWRHAVHPEAPDQPVSSRDLLEVEVLNERRTKRLFTPLQHPPEEPLRALRAGPGGRSSSGRRAPPPAGRGAGPDRLRPDASERHLPGGG